MKIVKNISFSGDVIAWIEVISSPSIIQEYRNHILSDLIILSSVILVISSLTIVIFLKLQLRPLRLLTDFSRQLSLTSSKTIELENSPYEFIILMRALNWASIEINKQYKELMSQNDLLDDKVNERTIELETAKNIAEKASKAKSNFLSSMSHELRTPMHAILGFAQLLDLEEECLDEVQKNNVKEILIAGTHLMNLIDDALDLTKIESGNIEVSLVEVNIGDVLQECINLLSPDLAKRQINLANHSSSNKYIVKADALRLKQVLINILTNAVKYNREQGKISIDVDLIGHQWLRLSITDTGEGLTNDELKKVFIPFERLDAHNSVDGVGIGLVLSKHLIELMDGNIGAKSKLGEGSSFWIELELAGNKSQ